MADILSPAEGSIITFILILGETPTAISSSKTLLSSWLSVFFLEYFSSRLSSIMMMDSSFFLSEYVRKVYSEAVSVSSSEKVNEDSGAGFTLKLRSVYPGRPEIRPEPLAKMRPHHTGFILLSVSKHNSRRTSVKFMSIRALWKKS